MGQLYIDILWTRNSFLSGKNDIWPIKIEIVANIDDGGHLENFEIWYFTKKDHLIEGQNGRKWQFLSFDAYMRANGPHNHLKSIRTTFGSDILAISLSGTHVQDKERNHFWQISKIPWPKCGLNTGTSSQISPWMPIFD